MRARWTIGGAKLDQTEGRIEDQKGKPHLSNPWAVRQDVRSTVYHYDQNLLVRENTCDHLIACVTMMLYCKQSKMQVFLNLKFLWVGCQIRTPLRFPEVTHMPERVQVIVCEFELLKRNQLPHPVSSCGRRVRVHIEPAWHCWLCLPSHHPENR